MQQSNANRYLDISKIYRETFRQHCLCLIGKGYATLDCQLLKSREEPDVTGCLVNAIEMVMQAKEAPKWASRYSIKDDPPISISGKYGKDRPRADLAFEWVRRGKRPLLRFEAKWIGNKKRSLGSKKGYLGDEGIGSFLSGYYPAEIGYAGMLAYVHSEDSDVWGKKIENKLSAMAEQLKIRKVNGQVWEHDRSQEQFHSFVSIHDCSAPVGELHITHFLLQFC